MEKHGIDFVRAQEIWKDPNVLKEPARTEGERRSALIGLVDGIVWTAIVTKRGDLTRIISVRRARRNERENYFSQ